MTLSRFRGVPGLAGLGLLLVGAAGCIADVEPVSTLASCAELSPDCGPKADENCCASPLIEGGEYQRVDPEQNKNYSATVSDFRLDRFEVTVGRFRKFVDGYPGNKPAAGDGAHPAIENSGWDASWPLPESKAELVAALKCTPAYQTWTDEPGASENKPVNCVSWYVGFAFCAWDEGRLPTEAEWTYAAAGGSEAQLYPWGKDEPDVSRAVFCADYSETDQGCPNATLADILKVGSKSPRGDGKWGQADLAGSLREWNLDWHDVYPDACDDCANLETGLMSREARGGDWNNDAASLTSFIRIGYNPVDPMSWVGLRCARRSE